MNTKSMNTKEILALIFISTCLHVCPVVCQLSECTDRKWFGSHCQYMCHCRGYTDCDQDGRCHTDQCEGGWFGPACQYADVAYKSWRNTTDGDDSTCVPETTKNRAVVLLFGSYSFTWMRVRLSKPDYLQRLTIGFRNDSSLPCLNEKSAAVDDLTLDIHCDLNETVETIVLTGEGVQFLCSVYVSGGRNVALKQNTTQSSTYHEQSVQTEGANMSFPSELAVDGDDDPDLYGFGTCSSTDNTEVKPHWSVSFPKSQRVNRYVLKNRDSHQDRLQNFTLDSFDESGNKVFNYTDSLPMPQNVYTVVTPTSVGPLVARTTIYASNRDNVLTLCEVEIFGESNCEAGRYGRDCEHRCNCAGDGTCFVSTGGCPSGCANGYTGEACDKPVTPTETIEPTINETTEPTVNETTEPTVNETTEPTVNETTEPTVNETTEPTVNETTEPTVNKTTEPTVNETTEPTVNETTEPNFSLTTEQTISVTTEPALNKTTPIKTPCDHINGRYQHICEPDDVHSTKTDDVPETHNFSAGQIIGVSVGVSPAVVIAVVVLVVVYRSRSRDSSSYKIHDNATSQCHFDKAQLQPGHYNPITPVWTVVRHEQDELYSNYVDTKVETFQFKQNLA